MNVLNVHTSRFIYIHTYLIIKKKINPLVTYNGQKLVKFNSGYITEYLFLGDNPRKWNPNDGGWHYHVASTASEWVVAISFCFYILSFAEDFRNLSLEHPTVSQNTHIKNVDFFTHDVICRSFY